MLVARPAKLSDENALYELARLAGPGFTSLAVGKEALKQRLLASVESFAAGPNDSSEGVFLLMVEDTKTSEVIGMSAVKSQIGIKDPFFNFRIIKLAQQSAVTKKRFDMEVLMLVNEYSGATEVGSLFVTEKARGTGAGRLISQARYMLIASERSRFGERVVSELRGHVDDTGYSPFWEAIGRKFFHMDFDEADQISASQNNQFILDLMPKHPIYAALLPKEAQTVMGQTHPLGVGARHFLETEGFRYDGMIDIFDGGPSVSAPCKDIRTIRDGRVYPVEIGTAGASTALVSNNSLAQFRCVYASVDLLSGAAMLSPQAAETLQVKTGDPVRLWIKS